MKYLLIIFLSTFVVGLAHADKYQTSSSDEHFVWVVNTETGQVKQCYGDNGLGQPVCSRWSRED